MRALHVLESLSRGGVETTFLNVLRALRSDPHASGDRHDVLSFGGGPLTRDYAGAADELRISDSGTEIHRVLSRHYDVIHVLSDRCALRLAPIVTAWFETPMVIAKNYDIAAMFRVNGGHDLSWEAAAIASADRVTFTTPQLSACYPSVPGRTTALRKAADVARFSRLPAPDAAVTNRILCVANLHPRKRIADLAPALQIVRRTVPDAELHVVGSGTPEAIERIRIAARAHGVDHALTLCGPHADIGPDLAGARVVVVPSASEGVPTVILEGMAAGRPVVAARSGHIGHVLFNGVEGFIVAAGDAAAMADRLASLLSDREYAARIGAAGRARASRHDAAAVAADILEVLRSASSVRRAA